MRASEWDRAVEQAAQIAEKRASWCGQQAAKHARYSERAGAWREAETEAHVIASLIRALKRGSAA